MRKLLLLCLIFWLVSYSLLAQDPAYLKLNIQKTMPSTTVYDLCEDRKGYIWLATDGGVFRYDGFQFKGFQSDSLVTGGCSALALDDQGDVWFENFDGYVFEIRQDTLYRLDLKQPPVNYIPFGLIGPYLLLPTRGGLDVYDNHSRTWDRFLSYSYQTAISASTHAGSYYFLNSSGLLQVDRTLQLLNLPYKPEIANRSILSLATDSGVYTLYKLNELQRIARVQANQDIRYLPFTPNTFVQGIHLTGGKLWVTSNEGAWYWSGNSWKGPYWKEHSISNIYEDRRGLLWISTLTEGLLIVPDFHHVYASFAPHSLYSLAPTPSGYVLGTGDGQILKSDRQLRTSGIFAETGISKPVSLLYYDHKTEEVIAAGNGVQFFDLTKGTLGQSFPISLKAFQRVNDRQFALSGSSFIGFLDQRASPPVGHITYEMQEIRNEMRGKALASRQDTVYFATGAGLFVYTRGEIQPLRYNGQALICKELLDFGGEILALSTLGNRYRIQGLQVSPDLRWGMEKIPVLKMTPLRDQLALLSSDKVRIVQAPEPDRVQQTYTLYRPADDILALLLEEQRLLMLDRNGVTMIARQSPSRKIEMPAFHLERILANDRLLNPLEKQSLDYTENTLEFQYALLSYGLPADPALFYSLNGETWTKAAPQSRTLRLAALAPGRYTLRFSYDANGQNILYQSREMYIMKPFWQRAEVLVLSLLSLVLIVFGYFQLQLNRFKEKNKALTEKIALEKELSHSTLTALRSQMNPHFFFNALNTIQAYIFRNDKHQAAAYLAKFSKLTRLILEQSAMDQHSLSEEVTALHLYLELEKMRFEEDFEFQISLDPVLEQDMIQVPAMLLQPYVENAVKHGLLHKTGEKRVEVHFAPEHQDLLVRIEDNGIGRKRAMELRQNMANGHRSFATEATARRLEVLNKSRKNPLTVHTIDKSDPEGRPLGTTVLLRLPLPTHADESNPD